VCVCVSNLHQQRVCGPTVNDTPAHFWPVASIAVVTVDGIQTAACFHKQKNTLILEACSVRQQAVLTLRERVWNEVPCS